MNKKKGRPRGSKKVTTMLLRYHGWMLEVDDNFPSTNYIVRKIGRENHRTYCGSLESALKTLFDCVLLETVNHTPSYTASMDALLAAILETRVAFSRLLETPSIIKNDNKVVENKTTAEQVALS